MFYGMFYGTVYDYNSHTHIIPTTPRYDQYQASFYPFRSRREKIGLGTRLITDHDRGQSLASMLGSVEQAMCQGAIIMPKSHAIVLAREYLLALY